MIFLGYMGIFLRNLNTYDVKFHIQDFEFNQGAIGEDCWYECGKKQGPCAWCGSEGWCCTQKSGWTDTSNGCDGTFGGVSKHECALKPSKLYMKLPI